ncbi:M20 family metallopeptidase [Parasalinivibrio latis]|uniref:M20 aminoacylase family protein n=1 Tax=Parasalinivibrio latis TaxID=2952610 RepID=UPI0030E46850
MIPLSNDLVTNMVQWRHHLHRFPECGFDIPLTSDFIANELESVGIKVIRGIGKTGMVGVLSRGQSSRSIGFRADMDALHINEMNNFEYCSVHSGKMHACGHDGHSAMLLGAAHYIAQNLTFDGTVYFIFQPDEEHGEGAKAMIDDGLFERFSIDEVYAIHNLPGLATGKAITRAGPIMASESSFEIVLNGSGGHAALPHKGTDPLVVGAQIVGALQNIVSRSLSAIEQTAVISVTEFITNGTVNVIPSEVILKGDCRCFGDDTLSAIQHRMEKIVKGLCDAGEISVEFEFNNTFHSTINTAEQTGYAISALEKVLGISNVESDCLPLTISEDFSSMLREKPGCYMLLGNGTDSIGGCALHNPNYDFNDEILRLGASYYIQLVIDRFK